MVSGANFSNRNIPISDLTPGPNSRSAASLKTNMKTLAASIAAIGLLEPLIVRKTKEGKYEVLAGGRRFAAIKHLQATKGSAERFAQLFPDEKIPVRVMEEAGESHHAVVTLAENSARENPTLTDVAAWVGSMRDAGVPTKDIAHICAWSEAYVDQLCDINKNLHAEAIYLVDNGILTHSTAHLLASYPPRTQARICRNLTTEFAAKGKKAARKAAKEVLPTDAAKRGALGAASMVPTGKDSKPRKSPYIPYPKMAEAAQSLLALMATSDADTKKMLRAYVKRDATVLAALTADERFRFGVLAVCECASGLSRPWPELAQLLCLVDIPAKADEED